MEEAKAKRTNILLKNKLFILFIVLTPTLVLFLYLFIFPPKTPDSLEVTPHIDAATKQAEMHIIKGKSSLFKTTSPSILSEAPSNPNPPQTEKLANSNGGTRGDRVNTKKGELSNTTPALPNDLPPSDVDNVVQQLEKQTVDKKSRKKRKEKKKDSALTPDYYPIPPDLRGDIVSPPLPKIPGFPTPDPRVM